MSPAGFIYLLSSVAEMLPIGGIIDANKAWHGNEQSCPLKESYTRKNDLNEKLK